MLQSIHRHLEKQNSNCQQTGSLHPRQLLQVPQNIGDTLRNDSRLTNHDSRLANWFSLFSNGRCGLSFTLHSRPHDLILLPHGENLQRKPSERPAETISTSQFSILVDPRAYDKAGHRTKYNVIMLYFLLPHAQQWMARV